MTDEIVKRVSLGTIDGLQRKEKGDFGEFLSGIYLKNHLKQNPSLVADVDPDDTAVSTGVAHVNGPFAVQRLVFDKNGTTWEPDFSFELTILQEGSYSGPITKKRVFIEAKTSSETVSPSGNQLEAMQLTASETAPIRTTGLSQPTTPDEILVFFCHLRLRKNVVDLTYKRIKASDEATQAPDKKETET